MSRFYPYQLPASLRNDPRRRAEVQLYDALKTQLPNAYAGFYSFAWIAEGGGKRAVEGEADFIIAHPERGVLVIEVKGGGISYDGELNQWTSTDRAGHSHVIKDPVEQARRNKFALRDKLALEPTWRRQPFSAGHAVAFPDTLETRRALKPDLPRDLVFFFNDMTHICDRVEAIYAFWVGTKSVESLGEAALEALIGVLAPSFTLRVPLAVELSEDDQRILELTENQFNVLEALRWQRRVAVSGGAGTGKTTLAVHKARQLAATGHRTALLTFNRPLADALSAANSNLSGLQICTFHQLCSEGAKRAGLNASLPRDAAAHEDFYSRVLPTIFFEALEARTEEPFDAIVVDEGQDFASTWWTVLEYALLRADGGSGILYVFFDDNQRLYDTENDLPRDLIQVSLVQNLRNTGAVFKYVSKLYRGPKFVSCAPVGRPVEFVPAESPERIPSTVGRVLHRLVHEHAVPRTQIVILTGRAQDRSVLRNGQVCGSFTLVTEHAKDANKIQLESLHRFKGLEREVVVLTDLEDVADRSELLYVGLSRARLHLVIVASTNTLARIEEIGRESGITAVGSGDA